MILKVKYNNCVFNIESSTKTIFDSKMQRVSLKDLEKHNFKDSSEAYIFLKKIYDQNAPKDNFCDKLYFEDLVKQNLRVNNDLMLPNILPEDIFKNINYSRIKTNDYSSIISILDKIATNHSLSFYKIFLDLQLNRSELKKYRFMQEPYFRITKNGIEIIPFLVDFAYKVSLNK